MDGLFMRGWLIYQSSLPRHPEPVEEQSVDGRVPGLVDESN